jgi:hypothetical protein
MAGARRMNSVRRLARRVTRRGLGATRTTVGPQMQSGDLAKDGDQLVISAPGAACGHVFSAKTRTLPRTRAAMGGARLLRPRAPWPAHRVAPLARRAVRLDRTASLAMGSSGRVPRPSGLRCLHCRKDGPRIAHPGLPIQAAPAARCAPSACPASTRRPAR